MRVAIMICAGALLHSVAASAASLNDRSLSKGLRSLSIGPESLSLRQDDGGDDGGDDGDDGGDNDNGGDNGDNGDGDNGESPHAEYLDNVCFVNIEVATNTPCSAFQHLSFECQANGTAPIDLLAEQECICGSDSYFDMLLACNACMKVHGGIENEDFFDTSIVSSASAAFCTGTPVTEFNVLLDDMIATAVVATVTGTDLFPSETAVSLYYKGKIETNPGQITGSATLAVSSASFTSGFVESTGSSDSSASTTSSFIAQTTAPTHTGSSSASSTGASTSTGTSTSTNTSTSASATGNAASNGNVVSGMLQGFAALIGIIYMM